MDVQASGRPQGRPPRLCGQRRGAVSLRGRRQRFQGLVSDGRKLGVRRLRRSCQVRIFFFFFYCRWCRFCGLHSRHVLFLCLRMEFLLYMLVYMYGKLRGCCLHCSCKIPVRCTHHGAPTSFCLYNDTERVGTKVHPKLPKTVHCHTHQ